MIKTILFITQTYLKFASSKALIEVKKISRLVLIIPKEEVVDKRLQPYFDDIIFCDACLNQNIQPLLNYQQLHAIVKKELLLAGGENNLRLFCHNECNVLLAAKLRKDFNIPGDKPDLVTCFRDKLIMKQVVQANGISIPRYTKLDKNKLLTTPKGYYKELISSLGNKLVIKPTDSAGSFNVAIVNNLTEFMQARARILGDIFPFDYEIDEFISGTLFQCDSFIKNGIVTFCGALELGCTNFDFVSGKPLSVYPVISSTQRDQLEQFNQAVITALGFKNGSTHHEFFLDKINNKLVFLEIAARVPGGIGVPFHHKNSNINLIDANLYLTAALDIASHINPVFKNNMVSALLPVGHGTIIKFNEPDLESRYEIEWTVQIGDVVDARSLIDNAGILTFYNDDAIVLRRDFERLQSYMPVICH